MKGRVGRKFGQLGERLFSGTPRRGGNGAECFEARKELCTEEVDMLTKGLSSVKGHIEKLGGVVK